MRMVTWAASKSTAFAYIMMLDLQEPKASEMCGDKTHRGNHFLTVRWSSSPYIILHPRLSKKWPKCCRPKLLVTEHLAEQTAVSPGNFTIKAYPSPWQFSLSICFQSVKIIWGPRHVRSVTSSSRNALQRDTYPNSRRYGAMNFCC